jgi:hypothetical protein
MVPRTSILGQTLWMIGCVCQIVTSITIASIGFACCWELDWCEGLCSKLCSCSNQFKSWLFSNSKFDVVGFKIGTDLDVKYPTIGLNQDGIVALRI